jgi:hypothetical protein
MTRSEVVEELERLCAEAATARERLHGLMNAVAALKETFAGARGRGQSPSGSAAQEGSSASEEQAPSTGV